MKKPRLSKPPRSLRRSAVPLDNVALVPASLLPFKSVWQAIANHLPHGDMLIVLPYQAKQQNVARFVAARLREKGKHVKVINNALQKNVLSRGPAVSQTGTTRSSQWSSARRRSRATRLRSQSG